MPRQAVGGHLAGQDAARPQVVKGRIGALCRRLREARQSEVGFGRAIASVASAGYFGLFAGPPIIGSIAQLIGLQRALLLVAVAIMLTLLLTRIVLGRSKG